MSFVRPAFAALRRHPSQWFAALFAIALGTAALSFFLSLGRGAEHAVVDELLTQLPVNVVKVQARGGLNFGPLQLGGGGLLSPALDENARQSLLKLPGVQAVHGLIPARFPMRVSGGKGFLGRTVYADMFAVGIDPAFVADEVPSDLFTDPGANAKAEQSSIPVIASTRVLSIYNSTVAPAIGAPKLNAAAIKNFEFDLFLGESYTAGKREQRRHLRARLVGLSDKVPLAGISVPSTLMQRWNKEFAALDQVPYSAAFVVTRSARDIDGVVKKAQQLGLEIDDSAQLAGSLVQTITGFLSLLAGLILLLGAALTAKTFEARNQAKRKEIALLIALGSAPRQIRQMLLVEALMLGILGALLGQVLGLGAAWLAQLQLAPALNALASRPLQLIALDWPVFVVPPTVALLFAWLGGRGPARRAAGEDPVRVLGNAG